MFFYPSSSFSSPFANLPLHNFIFLFTRVGLSCWSSIKFWNEYLLTKKGTWYSSVILSYFVSFGDFQSIVPCTHFVLPEDGGSLFCSWLAGKEEEWRVVRSLWLSQLFVRLPQIYLGAVSGVVGGWETKWKFGSFYILSREKVISRWTKAEYENCRNFYCGTFCASWMPIVFWSDAGPIYIPVPLRCPDARQGQLD